ncbi:MAG: molybdopterin-dependent oxidoreductase [Acidimicrobiia bacterium]
MTDVRSSICRICNKMCPIEVHVEGGRVVEVTGDRANALYRGYTCVKGRAMPDFVNHPDRLLRTLRRVAGGGFEPVPVEQALDEIAERIGRSVEQHGPRSVAVYTGTQLQNPAAIPLAGSFLAALGSPMQFGAATLDKPGRTLAWAMLGRWMAPHQNFHDPRVALMIGINPFVNGLGGVPLGHPGHWLAERLAAGMELVVVDPRRTPVADRATVFLQPAPGHDVALLAAMLRVVLREGRHDAAFVADNVRGVEALARAVEPFDPVQVAVGAGVDADLLVRAARTFAGAGRGYVVAGTGPHMATPGTLMEYLALCLDTVCGHWMRAGEVVRAPGVLSAPTAPKAQAADPRPAYGYGERSRVRGLGLGAAGMPSATLADEILLEGPGQVRVLISCGGNPAAAFPDQRKAVAALRSLDLLVQVDPWMSQTARHATYVVAPRLPVEAPGTTQKLEGVMRTTYATGYGYLDDHAQYAPAAVEPPPGAEVVEEWEVFWGLARRLGLPLELRTAAGDPVALDMAVRPRSDDLVALLCRGSRVPLDEVRRHPHGALFPADPPVVVAPRDPGWTGRLDVGNPDMVADLEDLAASPGSAAPTGGGDDLPYRLIVRRMMHVVNSSYNTGAVHGGRNPAFLHPDDLAELGIGAGDEVELRSAHDAVPATVGSDPTLRRGTVSMSFGFGGDPESDDRVREIGSSAARLLRDDVAFDRYSGQPRMSGVPVAVVPRAGRRPAQAQRRSDAS